MTSHKHNGDDQESRTGGHARDEHQRCCASVAIARPAAAAQKAKEGLLLAAKEETG